jgi:uncharacterized spore protein YtfJ
VARKLKPGTARVVGLRGLISRLGGARLCFGEPVKVGERTVIPVARVKAAGGGGFGSGGDGGSDNGGGGGGWLEAMPMGFIDAGPEGAHFQSIPDPDAPVRALKGGATALATLVTTIAGVRAIRRQRGRRELSPRRLLGR